MTITLLRIITSCKTLAQCKTARRILSMTGYTELTAWITKREWEIINEL